MEEGLTKVQVSFDCLVEDNNEKETKILEITNFANTADIFMRELIIKKDKVLITTWLKALGDKELLNIYTWIKEIMDERNISK